MDTTRVVALLRREWLQHRFGWGLVLMLPPALALVVATLARVSIDGVERLAPEQLPLAVVLIAVLGATLVMLAIAAVTGLFISAGLARRDHADRSVEFWLSLPTTHSASLGVPLIVELLLWPAAAVLVGWPGGHLLSMVVVGRIAGFGAWAALPWPDLLAVTLALVARLLGGLPLAVLWVLPLVLLLVVAGAWFKRWGFVLLIVGFGLANLLQQLTTGQRWIGDVVREWLRGAARSLIGAGGAPNLSVRPLEDPVAMLATLPGWAWHDFTAALGALASPYFAAALFVSAACFALLVQWRRRGASSAA